MSPTPDLRGQVAVVTGGGRGLGRAFAVALARAGAAVAVTARTAWELEETAGLIAREGGRVLVHPAEVTNGHAVTALTQRVERELGPIDLLVNNAGTPGPLGPLAETDPAAWWRCLEVNLGGPMLCMRAVLPGMIEQRRGRIVNVASGAGTIAIPHLSAYVTSKTALIRLTEVVAAETAEQGVRVFAIEPGTVRTAMTEYALQSVEGRRWMPRFGEIFESGRDVAPEQAAELVVAVASGRLDGLSGRMLSQGDDLPGLARRAAEIARRDLLVLRLRTPE